MIRLEFREGRGYLIIVSTKPKIIDTLYEQGITDEYGFLLKVNPDIPLKIHELFPTETIKISKEVNKFLRTYKKILQINIEDYQKPSMNLYPHQIENIRRGLLLKCLINADDTGLGKTISTIGFLNVLYGMKQSDGSPWLKNLLIITPATLIEKWIGDFHQYSDIELYKMESLSTMTPMEIRYTFNNNPYKIISIDTLKRYHMYIPLQYDAIVIDEVHNIKNKMTKRFSSVSEMSAPYKVFLSATPLINRPEELHYISKILNPSLLGSLYSFEDEFYDISTIELPNGTVIRKIRGIKKSNLDKLQRIVGSFITRHTWADTELNIPTNIINIEQSMTEPQMQIYDIIKRKYRHNTGLEVITYLQEICNSPHLIKQKLSIYDIDDDVLYDSWKTKHLHDVLIPELFKDHDQVVIFTKFRRYCDYIYKKLSVDYKTARITGHVSQKSRDRILKEFRNGEYSIIVADDALSYGHDLQTATALINMELPLSPGVYDQRIGRIRRVGQNREVSIYNYITKNSIEERIASMINEKREYFNQIVDNTKIIQEVLFEEFNDA